jgi:ribosome-associated protein
MIQVNEKIWLDENELKFAASRSSGPGGQHVNKTSTRMTVSYNIRESKSLTQEQKAKILAKLAGRIDKDGVISISSGESRSQVQNRQVVVERLVTLLRGAMTEPKRRKKTRVPYGAKQARLESKKRRSEVKRQRRGEE